MVQYELTRTSLYDVAVKKTPVLLVHGGAWAIPELEAEAHELGVKAALEAGWRVLVAGGSCLDAVEASVAAMEDDGTFDAGRGSFLTSPVGWHAWND
jgi:L-asparaginase / beta-aspartyl-peptidase